MTLPDDLFDVPEDPTRPAREPRQHRHAWGPKQGVGRMHALAIAHNWDGAAAVCVSCGKVRDETATRRGRNNRARGNAIEREIGKRLGLRRVGQYGGPDDLKDALFSAQVKSGGAFPERFWRWLKAVPVDSEQTALLVVTDAPGQGHRRRAVVVLDIDDWQALHGGDTE